jgi:putative glycosyltransferase (TIGR04372 family)
MVPIGYFSTYLKDAVGITKKHWLVPEQRWLSLRETFGHGVGYCLSSAEYEARGVELVENTPEEIRDVAIEMEERLRGTWRPDPVDDALQRRLWELYPVDARDVEHRPLHRKIRARWGARFLRDNPEWLAY